MPVFDIKNISHHKNEIIEKPLIMLVDDEIENINVLKQLLGSKFEIMIALNGSQALKLIDEMANPQQIQLIISDQQMPGVTGVEFLEKIIDKMPETIRIILTGYSDTQVIIDSINKAKLYKFMTKPFDPVELSLTVQRGVEAFQMRKELTEYSVNLEQIVVERTQELNIKNNELTQALHTLEKVSITDQLTQVYNRYFLKKFMPHEIAKLKRKLISDNNNHANIALIMVDIDHFKYINDTFGHDAGDKLLVTFTQILRESCRESDWIVRWGGEEFVIVIQDLTQRELQSLASRIIANVENHMFDLGCGQTISRTCSLGLSSYPFYNNEIDLLTWEETLNLADLALYAVKNNGKNAWLSLNEKGIKEPNEFYHNAMTNIVELVEQNQLSFASSLDRKNVVF